MCLACFGDWVRFTLCWCFCLLRVSYERTWGEKREGLTHLGSVHITQLIKEFDIKIISSWPSVNYYLINLILLNDRPCKTDWQLQQTSSYVMGQELKITSSNHSVSTQLCAMIYVIMCSLNKISTIVQHWPNLMKGAVITKQKNILTKCRKWIYYITHIFLCTYKEPKWSQIGQSSHVLNNHDGYTTVVLKMYSNHQRIPT